MQPKNFLSANVFGMRRAPWKLVMTAFLASAGLLAAGCASQTSAGASRGDGAADQASEREGGEEREETAAPSVDVAEPPLDKPTAAELLASSLTEPLEVCELPPRPDREAFGAQVPAVGGAAPGGVSLAEMQGRWVIVAFDPASGDAATRELLNSLLTAHGGEDGYLSVVQVAGQADVPALADDAVRVEDGEGHARQAWGIEDGRSALILVDPGGRVVTYGSGVDVGAVLATNATWHDELVAFVSQECTAGKTGSAYPR